MIPQNHCKYKVFRQKFTFDSANLSFDRARNNAFDDMLLAKQIEYYNRYDSAQNEIREQIVVPNPHCVEYRNGDCGGFEYREHNPEEALKRIAAVDCRRLLDFKRYALYKARQHKYRKSCTKA